MSANNLLSLLLQLLFILLSLVTAIDYFRNRGKRRLDIALMFASLGATILIQVFVRATGTQSSSTSILVGVALMAQPYLLLRLVRYLQPVPARLMQVAMIGMIVSWVALVLASLIPHELTVVVYLAIIAYFAAINGYAMLQFIRGAVTASGVVRQRMRFAAAGSGLLAMTLAIVVLGSLASPLREFFSTASQIAAIASALSFYISFAPARPLRRVWQLAELREFLLRITGKPMDRRLKIGESLEELCDSAIPAVGGNAAAVIRRDDMSSQWVRYAGDERVEVVTSAQDGDSAIEQVWRNRTPVSLQTSSQLTSGDRQLLQSVASETLHIAPIITVDRVWGLLLVFQKHSSLFLEDDLEMVTLLAQQSAIFLENSVLVEEIQHNAEELEKRVAERTLELRDSREQYRRIVDTAQEGIWMTDTENKTVFANYKMAAMLGCTLEELMSTSAYSFLDDEGKARVQEARSRRSSGIAEQYELKFRRRDGSDLWALISATPLFGDDGRLLGSLAMLADITQRKRDEEEIRQLNTELEERVAERTLELSALNRELEAFAYSVSHDLRTPLRGIDGFSQALLEDYADQLDERGQSYLRRVRSAAQRMALLIDDLLDLSRISRAEMEWETVDLSNVAQGIIYELQQSQPEREADFVIDGGLVVEGDPRLLRIALENLLRNAWKFSSKIPRACIEVRKMDQDGKAVYFVRDNGAGFDMAYADKLFGAFQRLHNITEFEGTGIGLATVQRILQRHGGRIWAEAAVDHGATFYFTL